MSSGNVEHELRKGDTIVSPFDKRLKVGWGRFRGLILADKVVVFKPKAYSVEAYLTEGRRTRSAGSLPYGVWIDSQEVVGVAGFSLLLRQPSGNSSAPAIFVRWEPQPREVPSVPSTEQSTRRTRQHIPEIPRERPKGAMRCASCREHRRPVSLVDTLVSDIGRYAGTGITALRNRLLEEELNIASELEEEFTDLETAVIPNQSQEMSWSRRPTTHSYCGLSESAGAWYFEKAKNPNGECTDMRPQESATGLRSCSTCAHNRSGPESLVAAIQECLTSTGPQASKLLDDFDRELASRAEYEVTAAFRGIGRMPIEPKLLPLCRSLSHEGTYVVGPCVNPMDRCRKWEDDQSVTRPTEGSLAALDAWEVVLRERKSMSNREAAVDPPAIGNIWDISTVALGEVLNSTSLDDSRVKFLASALPVVGIPVGKAAVIVAQAERALRDERRIPYTPPIPRSYG